MGDKPIVASRIAIVSSMKTVHRRWEARIRRNAKALRVTIKDVTRGTFCGIEFGADGWRTAKGLGPWEKPVTKRDIFRIVETLLWDMRVRGLHTLAECHILDLLRVDEALLWESPHPRHDKLIEALEGR